MNHKTIDTAIDISQMAMGFQASRILLTAVELDLFTHIGVGRISSAKIAKLAKADPRATDRLMNALCTLGLLKKEPMY